MNVIIYTQDMCGYCDAAIREFTRRDWDYTVHNIKNPINYNNLKELIPDLKTVPQIWIEKEHIGGYDDLLVWLRDSDDVY